jgi:predicted RNase H-like nuclease (RuvC/YqgF family)
MKGQKQSRTDALEKRMAAVTNVLQQLINEVNNLKTMVFGHQEILKQLEGYDNAIEKLKKKVAEEPGKTEEVNSDRKIIE